MASVHRMGLTQLSTTNNNLSSAYQINIIFVHGLRGHPRTTWETSRTASGGDDCPTAFSKRKTIKSLFSTRSKHSHIAAGEGDHSDSSADNVFWPAEFLDPDLPEARVWTYGYNADMIGGIFEANNNNSVSQHGRDLANQLDRDIENQDPIIFVAHSLGGIIVKDALHRSAGCRSRTRLVVFLGTPHRGSSLAGWGIIASNLASIALHHSNKGIVETLKVNGEVLDNIQDEFQAVVLDCDIRIHSFQEARGISGVKGLSGKVVDDFSSKIGLPAPFETVESIDADHIHMARCTSRADQQYRAISGVLKQFVRSGPDPNPAKISQASPIPSKVADEKEVTTKRPSVPDENVNEPCYVIQLSKNKRFIGRTAILDALEDKFFGQNECQKIALVGLGGVGKTQVALQFAYRVKESRPDYSIFWVPTLSDRGFEQAYTEMAKQLGVQKASNDDDEDIKYSMRRHLNSDKAGKWLLIVDNADDRDLIFGSAEKPGGIYEYLPDNENGLILLTTRSRQIAVEFAQSDVIGLNEMDAEEATRFLENSLIRKQELLQDGELVAELLDELTYLPLAIAQAAAYLNQTQMSIRKYLGLLRGAESDMAGLLSREFNDRTRYRDSNNAVATTWLISFDQIQRFNKVAVNLLSFISCIEPKAIPQSILPNPRSEETEWAIGTLCGYSFLVRRGDSDLFDIHSLVHMATRVWIKKHGQRDQVTSSTISHLASLFSSSDLEDRDWRKYLPHALQVLYGSNEYEVEDRYELFMEVGLCLDQDRRFVEAARCFKEVYTWRSERYPEHDKSRLKAEFCLGSAYHETRRIKDAIRLLEHVVMVESKILGEKDHSRLMSQLELAKAYLSDRRTKDGIEILEHVVAVQRETMDEQNESRLASEHELAGAYLDDGRTEDAINLFEHVVAVEKVMLDEQDHARLASEHELARAYLGDAGRIKDVIQIFEHVVAIRKQTLNEQDHSRLASEHALATAYSDDGRVKDAIKILEHVVAVEKAMLDEQDYSRLTSEHELAKIYVEDKRVKDAIEIFEHVVAVKKEIMDAHDHSRLVSEAELGRAYLDDGRIEDATKIFEGVLATRRETLDEQHPSRLFSEHELGVAYLDNGRTEEAIEILKHVVAVRRETLNEQHHSRRVSEHELARAYLAHDEVQNAINLLEHVTAIEKEVLPEDDPGRLISVDLLTEAYKALEVR